VLQIRHILHKGLDVLHEPEFIAPERALELLEALKTEADWHRPAMQMYGKTVHTRRQVAWHADEGYVYKYSGQEHVWRDWTPAMTELRTAVEARMSTQFNGVLLNMYADGTEYVSPHSDDEDDLEDGSPVVCVSLGAERDFVFKMYEAETPDQEALRQRTKFTVALGNGDLVVMAGDTQKVATHAIPKRARVTEPRISLTFRKMIRRV
jgi:alkylated DNA repair dioxygenase AlkB